MDLLTNAHWWVIVLFLILVGIGLRATRGRTIPFKRLIILPGIFTIWNILWLAERLQGHYSLFLFWVIGLSVGSFFGWLTVRHWVIHADRHHHRITIPGCWSTLILILLVFAVRFFFVSNYQLHPELAPTLFTPDALISGTITGIFIGRAYQLYRMYQSS